MCVYELELRGASTHTHTGDITQILVCITYDPPLHLLFAIRERGERERGGEREGKMRERERGEVK